MSNQRNRIAFIVNWVMLMISFVSGAVYGVACSPAPASENQNRSLSPHTAVEAPAPVPVETGNKTLAPTFQRVHFQVIQETSPQPRILELFRDEATGECWMSVINEVYKPNDFKPVPRETCDRTKFK